MIYFNNNNSFPELSDLDDMMVIENEIGKIHLKPLIAIDSLVLS